MSITTSQWQVDPVDAQDRCAVTLTTGYDRTRATMELKCTPAQLTQGLIDYGHGALIQNAFKFLDANEREFLMTGLTPAAWDELFRNEQEA